MPPVLKAEISMTKWHQRLRARIAIGLLGDAVKILPDPPAIKINMQASDTRFITEQQLQDFAGSICNAISRARDNSRRS